MAIAFDSSGTATGNSVATLTIDITSAAVGALCYCWIAIGAAPDAVTFTGWTNLVDGDEGVASHYSGWYRQKLTGDTTFAPSWGTAEGSSACWMSYTGVNTTTPHEDFGSATHTVSSVSFVTPTGTPTTTGRWAVSFYDGRSTSAAFTFTNATATQRQQVCNTSNHWMSVSAADSNGTVAATSQSYTATSSASMSHGATGLLFLIPAGAATAAYVPAETTQLGGFF